MWHVEVNGEWHQVADDAALVDLARRGIVGPGTRLRRDDWSDVVPMSTVAAFSSLSATGAGAPRADRPVSARSAQRAQQRRVVVAAGAGALLVGALVLIGSHLTKKAEATALAAREAACTTTLSKARASVRTGAAVARADLATATVECRASRSADVAALERELAAREVVPGAPDPVVGATVKLIDAQGGRVSVSKRPEKWGDTDIAAQLVPGTPVVLLERRDYPLADGATGIVRFRVEFSSGGRKATGWVHGSAIPGFSTDGPRAAAPTASKPSEDVPVGVVLLKANYVGAPTEAQLATAHEIVASGDRLAFDRFVRGTPGVFLTPEGMKVSLVPEQAIGKRLNG